MAAFDVSVDESAEKATLTMKSILAHVCERQCPESRSSKALRSRRWQSLQFGSFYGKADAERDEGASPRKRARTCALRMLCTQPDCQPISGDTRNPTSMWFNHSSSILLSESGNEDVRSRMIDARENVPCSARRRFNPDVAGFDRAAYETALVLELVPFLRRGFMEDSHDVLLVVFESVERMGGLDRRPDRPHAPVGVELGLVPGGRYVRKTSPVVCSAAFLSSAPRHSGRAISSARSCYASEERAK